MIEIKCKKDIKKLYCNKGIPADMICYISEEFAALKNWCDEDNQDTIDTFNTDNYGYGYIAILEGNETEEEIKQLGLSEGLAGVIPEDAVSYTFEGNKWTKIIVVYNDSYSMSFWLKNSNQFDSYEYKLSDNEANSGSSISQNFEIF